MTSTRSNSDVAQVFLRLADYLELAGENPFKTRAYRAAAETLRGMSEPIARVADEGRLDTIPGFGPAIRAKTVDILATGTTPAYEKARTFAPEGVLEFLRLPGIGVKTVQQLWHGLNVTNIDELEQAARDGRVRVVAGLGEKTEAKLLDSIARYRSYGGALLLSEAIAAGDFIIAELLTSPGVSRAAFAGDLERGVETVTAIEIVAATTEPEAAAGALSDLTQVSKITEASPTHIRAVLNSEAMVDIALVSPSEYDIARLIRTGSTAHVARLRAIAEAAGLHLTEHGLFRGDFLIPTTDESSMYAALGLPSTLR